MNIIKRNGVEVEYDEGKIVSAITRANGSVSVKDQITDGQIEMIASNITEVINSASRTHTVEEIQDMVEEGIASLGAHKLAKNYIVYRYQHQLDRESSTFLDKIGSILNCNNEEIQQENANKNPTILPTQRDYMAGEVSKWYARERLFPKELIAAHEAGIIHIHDMDYASMKLYNCCLINMDDMLQNGTVISGTAIDKPKSFTTACNVATQIMAQVASSQLGGQTTSVYHISKFVDVSRQKFITQEKERLARYNLKLSDEDFNNLIEELVAEEITKGVQMIQYQINTLMTSNGQTPFCSLFIYLKEAPEGRERDDLALVASEIFRQRIKGIKNKKGAWVAPAFPKLLYVLDTENHDETCKYWYLTKLAAECTSKRMVPDYISEKIMNSYKDGNTYGCMGAVHKDSVVHYKVNGKQYVGTIKDMYENIKNTLNIDEEDQFNQAGNPNKDINLKNYNVEIFDSGEDRFVKCEMMNKNVASNFKLFKITIDCDGVEKTLIATNDHPLMSPVLRPQYIIPNLKYEDEDVLHVEDLEIGDKLYASRYVSTSAEGLLAGCATPCLSTVTKIEELTNDEDFVYDVTTETGHFMVNDIFSHNCRAFLSVWRDPDTGIPKFYGRLTKLEVKPTLNCVNA